MLGMYEVRSGVEEGVEQQRVCEEGERRVREDEGGEESRRFGGT